MKKTAFGQCAWDGVDHPVCGVRKDCMDGGKCPHLVWPELHSCWRDKGKGTAYTVRSVDYRGVFLKQLVLPGFCRMPFNKFYERFERVVEG